MSYLCENEAEDIQNGDGYVAQEDAKCKKCSTRQWTMPTRLTLKINSGALGYLFYNGAPVSNSGRENQVSGSDYCARAGPIVDLYFFLQFSLCKFLTLEWDISRTV